MDAHENIEMISFARHPERGAMFADAGGGYGYPSATAVSYAMTTRSLLRPGNTLAVTATCTNGPARPARI